MLRTDRELALDGVTEICKLAADAFREAARIAHDSGLADFFREVSRSRHELLLELEEEIRKSGILPSEPDMEREMLDYLFTRLKAAVTGEEREVLLEKWKHIEEESEKRLKHALGFEFEGRIPEILQRIGMDIEKSRQRLERENIQD